MGTAKPHHRKVYYGLSRYYDINVLHDLAEAESGWDMTTRFGRRALNYVPVDLNSLLYKYETDFAQVAEILGDKHAQIAWQRIAEERKQTMNRLMWDRLHKTFLDYNMCAKLILS
jgi:alpha,alpha-trehalase